MKWSETTWQAADSIYTKILGMPFIKELSEGTLPLQKFQFYMIQDSLYLEHFGRALALIGAKATRVDDTMSYLRFAENAIVVEQALHESYFKEFGISGASIMEPSCHHYTHFLKSTAAFESVEIAMAATLPCFWIYKNVGEHILSNYQAANNPYHKWIDTYGGDDFTQAVSKAIGICDAAATQTDPMTRQKMTEAFMTASKLEYLFWDAAYTKNTWHL